MVEALFFRRTPYVSPLKSEAPNPTALPLPSLRRLWEHTCLSTCTRRTRAELVAAGAFDLRRPGMFRAAALAQLRSRPLEAQHVAARRQSLHAPLRVVQPCRLAPRDRSPHPRPPRQRRRRHVAAVSATVAGSLVPLVPAAEAPAAAEGLAAKLGLTASAAALLNAIALGCAWLVRAESVVEALSGSLLLLCAAALVDVLKRAADNSSGSALQLALESVCVTLVAVQSLEGLRWLAFSHAGVEAVARAVLPVASCAWVCRLGVASPLWVEHGAAIAAADRAVARAAAEGTTRRLLDVCALEADSRLQNALELLSRGSRFWLGTMAALSVADWALLAALWSAMEPVMGLPANSTFAAWHLPAMLALDGARLSTQLWHGILRGQVAGAHRPTLFILPAGVVSRLSLGLLFTNAACSGALIALASAVRSGPAAWSLLPRAVLAARFVRLICECAFLVAVAASRRKNQVTELRLGEARDTLAVCDAVWTETPLQPIRDVRGAPPALPALSALPQPPRLGLDAFSSLVLTGVRGYLRGNEAAEAVARVIAEADTDLSGDVSAAEIASWVEREAPDGGGVKWRASVRRVLGSLPAVSARVASPKTASATSATSPAYSCAHRCFVCWLRARCTVLTARAALKQAASPAASRQQRCRAAPIPPTRPAATFSRRWWHQGTCTHLAATRDREACRPSNPRAV